MRKPVLPEQYTDTMRRLLGEEEFAAYMESFEEKGFHGIRVNTLKTTPEELAELLQIPLEKIPFVDNGFYYDKNEKPAKHPLYYAGLFYIQEPSAMTPASVLPVEPGERVLDLCAAPGGKTTELGAKLQGKGVLIANDISVSRAKALAKNVQLHGIYNSIVLAESPEKLAGRFPGFFDKILVDAPCSGEGMFRRESKMMAAWMEHGPEYFAPIQRQILSSAVTMLKPGGKLLFSTCTFSPLEDEKNVEYILEQFPEMELLEIENRPGFHRGRPEWSDSGREDLARCVRIWPHKTKGEGHFLALFTKKGILQDSENPRRKPQKSPFPKNSEVEAFVKKLPFVEEDSVIQFRNGLYHWIPDAKEQIQGLRIIQNGLMLGEEKKGRFMPSQQLACALDADCFPDVVRLELSDINVIKYLKGETILVEDTGQKGIVLVCADRFALGWAKIAGGVVKNKYLPGWRMM